MQHETEKNKLIKDAINYEREEAWNEVVLIYEKLLSDFPDEQYLQQKLENAQLQESMAQIYDKALVMLQKGDTRQASQLLINIVSQTPTYRDAIYYLLLASRGINIFELQKTNNELNLRITNQAIQFQQLVESERNTFRREIANLKSQVESNNHEKMAYEQEIASLKKQIGSNVTAPSNREEVYLQEIARLKNHTNYLAKLATSRPGASL
jgi:hypothetical protein